MDKLLLPTRTQQVDETSVSSKLSSMFGGIAGVVNAVQSRMQLKDVEKTQEADLDTERKDEKVEDLEVVAEGLPNKTSFDESGVAYSSSGGNSHMSLLLEQKAQALELQRQGKGCDDCEDDGEGNILPSSLVKAIRLQKRKQETNLRQASVSMRGDGQTLLDGGATATTNHDDGATVHDEDGTERDLAGGRFDCRCEYPGEGIYVPEPKRKLVSRKRNAPRSALIDRNLMSGYKKKNLIAIDGKFILPLEHPACVNVDFICPGDLPESRDWHCPRVPSKKYKAYDRTRHVYLPSDHPQCQCTDDFIVTDQDFENGAFGWNVSKVESSGGFTSFLGRMGGGEVISTSFDNVPEDANRLSVEFDFYEIDDWEDANDGGTDCFYAWIGDEKLDFGLFGSRTNEGWNRGSTTCGIVWFIESQGSARNIGFDTGSKQKRDQIHHVMASVPESCGLFKDGQLDLAFQVRVPQKLTIVYYEAIHHSPRSILYRFLRTKILVTSLVALIISRLRRTAQVTTRVSPLMLDHQACLFLHPAQPLGVRISKSLSIFLLMVLQFPREHMCQTSGRMRTV